jgi:hypothetical protein
MINDDVSFVNYLNELPLIVLTLFITNSNVSLVVENGKITGIEERGEKL